MTENRPSTTETLLRATELRAITVDIYEIDWQRLLRSLPTHQRNAFGISEILREALALALRQGLPHLGLEPWNPTKDGEISLSEGRE